MPSRSYRVFIVCLTLLPTWLAAQTVKELPKSRTYVSAGIYEEAGQLHFERAEGPVAEPLGDWRLMGSPVGQLIGLVGGGGTEVRIVDRSGRQVGAARIPPHSVGVVTDRGVIATPKSLDRPIVQHDISFYSVDGKLLKEVRDPNLLLGRTWVEPDGRFITANLGPGKTRQTIVVYRADGTITWNYSWAVSEPAPGLPDVAVTADNRRLVLLQPDLIIGAPGMSRVETDLIVLAPGNKVLARHHLPTLYQLATSPDSRRVAAVGQNTVVLVDAQSGKLSWRKGEDIDFVVPGGLRFDPDGQQLLIVSSNREPAAGAARLNIRRLRLDDGEVERADLGVGALEQAPTVFGVEAAPRGETRITLHDRILDVPADAWQPP